MASDLAALGLAPTEPAPDAILMAQIERWSDLRRFVLETLQDEPAGRPEVREYLALTATIAETQAITANGAAAKLEAALVVMGARGTGWQSTVWHLPIRAVQDALRFGVAP